MYSTQDKRTQLGTKNQATKLMVVMKELKSSYKVNCWGRKLQQTTIAMASIADGK
jgi:hypothetical protein